MIIKTLKSGKTIEFMELNNQYGFFVDSEFFGIVSIEYINNIELYLDDLKQVGIPIWSEILISNT